MKHMKIARRLRDQVLLVAGAAGSIGSEVCRQFGRFAPRRPISTDRAFAAAVDFCRESFPDYRPNGLLLGNCEFRSVRV